MPAPELKEPVLLKDKASDGFWHFTIEKFILFRWEFFKNNPRGNYLVIKAFACVLIVSMLAILFSFIFDCFLERSIDFCKFLNHLHQNIFSIVAGFIGAVSVVYWNCSSIFNKKWTYCCDLYNEMLKLDRGTQSDELRYKKIKNALAMDLIVLDMWAHRSFKELFRDELEIAIKSTSISELKKNEIIIKTNLHELTENEALEILQKYQHHLLIAVLEEKV